MLADELTYEQALSEVLLLNQQPVNVMVDVHGVDGESEIPVAIVMGKLDCAPAEELPHLEYFPPGESLRLHIKGRDSLSVIVISQENFHKGFLRNGGLVLLVGCARITVLSGEMIPQIPEGAFGQQIAFAAQTPGNSLETAATLGGWQSSPRAVLLAYHAL